MNWEGLGPTVSCLFKGRGCHVVLVGPFGTAAGFQIRSAAGSCELGRLFLLAISHVAPLIGRKAKIAFTGAHSSSRQ